jgi:signal transduction histidine kinase
VQALCIVDLARGQAVPLRRAANVPLPKNLNEMDDMLRADPNSERRKLEWRFDLRWLRVAMSRAERREVSEKEARDLLLSKGARPDMLRGYIYLDLSRPALEAYFWHVSRPLLLRVAAFGGATTLALSAVAVFAYRALQRMARIKHRAQLEQQGMVAQRGLTAAVLAHEIRNPVQALQYQLHSLRRNASDPERVTAACDTIGGELSRIGQLVQDYLAHEKAQTMRPAPVDLGEAVEALRTIVDEMLRSTQTGLVIVAPPSPVVAICDPAMLRQALMNLVLNAQQAMGGGGRITITVGRDNGSAAIDVSDTGPGIGPEMIDRLFKPFQTSKKEGSGIGLAMVKRFVDNFGGSVSVESQPGQGATFHLRLPLSQ